MNKSWTIVTGKVRAQLTETYRRGLCLSQRIRYVPTYFLAKIWHTTQLFQVPATCTRLLSKAIAWYIQGVHGRNGPDFGRVFLMLNYTENPQNTYIQI